MHYCRMLVQTYVLQPGMVHVNNAVHHYFIYHVYRPSWHVFIELNYIL